MSSVAIVILAAGSSTRMGTPKQLLPLGHTTLLGTVIEHAKNTSANSIFCITGAHVTEIEKRHASPQVQFVYNPNFQEGLSSSIAKAVDSISESEDLPRAVFILLGDQPYVDAPWLQQYIDAHLKHPELLIATAYGTNAGVPALFPSHTLHHLQKLEGDQGAKGFITSYDKKILIQLPKAALRDIDSKEDYNDLLNNPSL